MSAFRSSARLWLRAVHKTQARRNHHCLGPLRALHSVRPAAATGSTASAFNGNPYAPNGTTLRLVSTSPASSEDAASGEASGLYKPVVSEMVGEIEVRMLKPQSRHKDGTCYSRWLRTQKLIPGIVYGQDSSGNEERLLVSMPMNQLQSELQKYGRSILNTLYDVKLEDGKVHRCFVRDLQLDAVSGMPTAANYLRYDPTRRFKLRIPIDTYNEEKSPGLKRGGHIRIVQRDVKVMTTGAAAVPARVRIDLGGAKLHEKLYTRDIVLPEGLEALHANNAVLTVQAKKQKGIDAEEDA